MSAHSCKYDHFVKDIPSMVFKKCPKCRSEELYHFEGESFCSDCPWNSITIHFDLIFEERLKAFKNGVAL